MLAPDAADTIAGRIRFAIAHKRLVEIRYRGSPRVVEPHDYGVMKGVERLLVYQLRGPVRASNRSAIGWRLLDVPKIEGCAVLDVPFSGSRSQPEQHHQVWDVVYARVK